MFCLGGGTLLSVGFKALLLQLHSLFIHLDTPRLNVLYFTTESSFSLFFYLLKCEMSLI